MTDTRSAEVPTLSLADQDRDPEGFAAALGESFERFGFAIVADHGVPAGLIDRACQATALLHMQSQRLQRQCTTYPSSWYTALTAHVHLQTYVQCQPAPGFSDTDNTAC